MTVQSVNFTYGLNNPGHIEIGAPWEGLSAKQKHGRFATFDTPEAGIRAIARVLITYQDKRRAKDGSRIDTVREIIERWAPSSDGNNVSAYAHHVRQVLRIGEGTTIDVKDFDTMYALVRGIIKHENGVDPYDDQTVRLGILMAGIKVPVKPLEKSRTKKASEGIVAATIVGGVAQVAAEMEPALGVLRIIGDYAPWAVGVIVIGLAVAIWWYRRQDQEVRVL